MVLPNDLVEAEEEANRILNTDEIKSQCSYYLLADGLNLPHGFAILHLNIRSLKNKFEDFRTFLVSSGVEWGAICLSETWLKPDLLEYYGLEGYTFFASCRKSGEGGGTGIYIHKKYEARERHDITDPGSEHTFVEIQLKHKPHDIKLIIGDIYRPPNYNDRIFLEELEAALGKLDLERKLVVLAGDYNFNLSHLPLNHSALSFSNLLSSHGYAQLISKPTRIQNNSATLLDNFFINGSNNFQKSGIIIDDLSDHFPIFIS